MEKIDLNRILDDRGDGFIPDIILAKKINEIIDLLSTPVSEKKEHLCRIGRIMRRTTIANCPLNCEDSVEEGSFAQQKPPDPGAPYQQQK